MPSYASGSFPPARHPTKVRPQLPLSTSASSSIAIAIYIYVYIYIYICVSLAGEVADEGKPVGRSAIPPFGGSMWAWGSVQAAVRTRDPIWVRLELSSGPDERREFGRGSFSNYLVSVYTAECMWSPSMLQPSLWSPAIFLVVSSYAALLPFAGVLSQCRFGTVVFNLVGCLRVFSALLTS